MDINPVGSHAQDGNNKPLLPNHDEIASTLETLRRESFHLSNLIEIAGECSPDALETALLAARSHLNEEFAA